MFPVQPNIEANHRLVDGDVLSWSKAALEVAVAHVYQGSYLHQLVACQLYQPQNNESTGPVSHTGDAPSHWDLWSPKIIFRVPLTHTPSQRCCRHSRHAMLLSTLLYDNQSNLVSQDFEKTLVFPSNQLQSLASSPEKFVFGSVPRDRESVFHCRSIDRQCSFAGLKTETSNGCGDGG